MYIKDRHDASMYTAHGRHSHINLLYFSICLKCHSFQQRTHQIHILNCVNKEDKYELMVASMVGILKDSLRHSIAKASWVIQVCKF